MSNLDEFSSTGEKDSFFLKIFFTLIFNIQLIFKNLKNRKRSTIIVILGLVFALSLLFTSSIWIHTSQKIIADDYIETLDYEMYVQTFLIGGMEEIEEFVINDVLSRQTDKIFQSVALFNFEDKEQDYRWYPEDQQENMSNPVSLSEGFIVPKRAMERISLNLEIEGNSTLETGEIMISYTQAKQLEQIYNEKINLGYKLNVAITRRIPNTDIGEHQMSYYDIDETSFYNYTIAGIYKYVGHNTIIEKLLGGGSASAGGVIVDSIFFPMEDLQPEDLVIMDDHGILPKLLVKTKAQELRKGGINFMADNLIALKERIEIRFYHAYCNLLSQEITSMTNEYRRIFSSTTLFVPTIVSAVFLTILSSLMTVKRRREEIAFLRSKGAVSVQIVAIFFGEFLFVSIVSLIISLGLGIIIAALIPAFSQDVFFNSTIFVRYFEYLEISPYDIEIFTVIVLGIYLGVTLINVIRFVRKDIHESFLVTRKGRQIIGIGAKVGAFALTFIGFVFIFLEYRKGIEETYTFEYSNMTDSAQTFLLYIGVILFVCYFVAIGLNFILKNAERLYKSIFRNGGFFVFKNIKRSRKSFTETSFFLLIIVCLLTMFITLRSTTIHNNVLENQYRAGSDIRIQSLVPINVEDFEARLQNIEGIQDTMGFYSTKASVGFQDVEVFGINPLTYLKMGRWIDTSFEGMDYETALLKLASDENGVILSEYSSTRLGFDVDSNIFITDFRGGPFYLRFTVSAIINSAPGLGAAHGADPKMNRITNEFALINEAILTDFLEINNGTLFIASIEEEGDLDTIVEQIREIDPLLIVNPERINPDYIGYFITNYIPPALLTLLGAAIFVNIIGVVYIVISTDFILEQRRRENAVLLALGGKQSRSRKNIVAEISVFLSSAIVIGVPLGIIATILSLSFVKPLLIPREIIPMSLHLNVLFLFLVILSLIVAAILGILPILRKQMKYEVVQELRAIV